MAWQARTKTLNGRIDSGENDRMKNHINPQLLNTQVEHKYSGGAWAVVQVLPDDMCRVVSVGKEELGKQAFLAWQKLLKPWIITFVENGLRRDEIQHIPASVQESLETLRHGLECGNLTVNNTRITACATP